MDFTTACMAQTRLLIVMGYTSTTKPNKQRKIYQFTLKKVVVKNWGPKPKFLKWMIEAIFLAGFKL